MSRTFIEEIAWGQKDSIAVIDDLEEVNFGMLKDWVGKISSQIHKQFGSGKFILIKATSKVSYIRSLLGIMASGNTPVPIDPQLPKGGIDFMMKKIGADKVLSPLPISEFEKNPFYFQIDNTIPALIMLTSGTSGYPKGVIITNNNLLYSCQTISQYLSYQKYRSAAVAMPLYYSYALISQVFCYLLIGGKIRLFSGLKNPLKFAQTVNKLELETFCGVPSMYQSLVSINRVEPLRMPSIKILCSAGAPMEREIFKEVKEIFPNALFFNNYGMTEAAPRISFIHENDPNFMEPTCGKPMEGVEVKIIDPDSREPLPEGQKGLLAVRGNNISPGYINNEELTEMSFTPDRFLISADIAYLKEGYIYICGRSDEIFNVGGEKISPLEIERALKLLTSNQYKIDRALKTASSASTATTTSVGSVLRLP